MKRIISLLSAALLLFSITAFASYEDVDLGTEYGAAISRLTSFGVISGDGNGSFRPDDPVTRAEFAKLAAAAVGDLEKVTAGQSVSPFTDVPRGHWANGFINYVSQKGYIKGYPDGSFHPDEYIPYSQVATVLVRMLGFTTEDVGYHWPDNYLEKVAALGISSGLWYGADDIMARKDVALLISRALDTDMKQQEGQPKKKMVDLLGYKKEESVRLIATKEQDVSVDANKVKTSKGTYEYRMDDIANYIGRTCDIWLDDEERLIVAYPKEQQVKTIVVDSVKGDDIYYQQDGQSGSFELDDETVVYRKGQQTSFQAVKPMVAAGSVMTVYSTPYGEVEYVFFDEGKLEGPVTLYSEASASQRELGGITIQENARVYRNGLSVGLGGLKRYDVIYYNRTANVVMAYDDKKTGIYEEAYPDKAYVESIRLSGTQYTIESKTATDKLNESPGSFKKNQKVTLLLGKEGQIADVIMDADSDLENLGVVLKTYGKVSEEDDTKGKMEYYADVMKYDGNVYSYKTNREYDTLKGAIAHLSFDENGVINKMDRRTNKITGKLDKAAMTLGGTPISKDVKVLELLDNPDDAPATARSIELSDIDADQLNTGNVIHAEVDKGFGDIVLLYVNNITGDGYQYGILKKASVIDIDTKDSFMISGTYTVDIAGAEQTFQMNAAYKSIGTGQPIGIRTVNGKLDEMFKLDQAADGAKIDAVDFNRIKVDGKVYPMAENVAVYEQKGTNNNTAISKNELEGWKGKRVRLYVDKGIQFGGKVRVIIVQN